MSSIKKKKRIRFDTVKQPDGSLAAAWGFRGQGDIIVKEYLAAVYRIPEDGRHVSGEMNYEFSLFMLDPSEGINYRKSIFRQSGLRPLLPAAARLQFRAEDDNDAIDRAQCIVETIHVFECCFEVPAQSADSILNKVFTLLSPSHLPESRGCYA